jgi:hypothetical protein
MLRTMKRVSPEFLAIPVVLIGLGILFAIFWAGNGGAARWIMVGLLFLAGIVGFLALVFRRPWGAAISGKLAPLDGGASPISDGMHRAAETDWLEQGVAGAARTRYGLPARAFSEVDR